MLPKVLRDAEAKASVHVCRIQDESKRSPGAQRGVGIDASIATLINGLRGPPVAAGSA